MQDFYRAGVLVLKLCMHASKFMGKRNYAFLSQSISFAEYM